jgi:hypothetical protein
MGRIYRQATRVTVWLGDCDDDPALGEIGRRACVEAQSAELGRKAEQLVKAIRDTNPAWSILASQTIMTSTVAVR